MGFGDNEDEVQELLSELVEEDVITIDFAKAVLKEGSLNAKDEFGNTLLHYVSQNSIPFRANCIQQLLELGATQKVNNYSETPLMTLFQSEASSAASIRFLISNQPDFLLKTDYEEKNVMHIACQSDVDRIEMKLQKFLENTNPELIQALVKKKDIYGMTPLDYAVEKNNLEILTLLSQYDLLSDQYIQQHPSPFANISQNVLNKKIMKYLSLQGIPEDDISKIIDKEGNCNGWSFLYLIYASKGVKEENKFFDILNEIATWDEKEDSLEKNLNTPLNKQYSSKKDLLEQISNDLILFHHDTQATSELQLGWQQKSRIEQYNLMHDPVQGRELGELFKFDELKLSQSQLIEWLDIISSWRGASVDIRGGQHVVSIIITPEGKFKYYDPNHKSRVAVFDSSEEMANHLIKFKYKSIRKIRDDKTVPIYFTGYKFHNRNAPELTSSIDVHIKNQSASATKFTKLHCAVLSNNLLRVRELLDEKPDQIDSQDANQETALMWAIRLGHGDIVNELIKRNANLKIVNNRGEDAMMVAIQNGRKKEVELLFTNGATINTEATKGYNALMLSSFHGHTDIAKFLLKHNANIKSSNRKLGNALVSAILNGQTESAKLLLENWQKNGIDINEKYQDNFTPLMLATMNRDATLVEFLLEQGAEINLSSYKKKTPLMYAAENGDENIVSMLIEKGAKVDLQDQDGNSALNFAAKNRFAKVVKQLLTKIDGSEELLKATEKGDLETINLLLGYGVSIKVANEDGFHALIYAIANQQNAIARRLIEFSQDNSIDIINLPDNHGNTPLMNAAGFGNYKMIKLLIKNGANIDEVNEDGLTALDITKEANPDKEEIIDYLKKCMEEKSSKTQSLIHSYSKHKESTSLNAPSPHSLEVEPSKGTKTKFTK